MREGVGGEMLRKLPPGDTPPEIVVYQMGDASTTQKKSPISGGI